MQLAVRRRHHLAADNTSNSSNDGHIDNDDGDNEKQALLELGGGENVDRNSRRTGGPRFTSCMFIRCRGDHGPSCRGYAMERLGLVFGVDVRSLAVARIVLSLVVIADVGIRLDDLENFYTDHGVLPRSAVLEHLNYDNGNHVSLWMAGGSDWWALLCFVLTAFAAGLYLVGFCTRASNAVLWFLVGGYQARAPACLDGGDDVLRLVLFWSMFLPMGSRLSLDATTSSSIDAASAATSTSSSTVAGLNYLNVANRSEGRREQVISGASLALHLQMAAIYYFAYLLKTDECWRNGEAVYYALSVDMFAKQPFASYILDHEWMWRNLTHLTFAYEHYGPILLLIPAPIFGLVRTVIVGIFMCMHVGFYLGLELGLFPAICIASWSLLLPGAFWDWVGWKSLTASTAPVKTETKIGHNISGVRTQASSHTFKGRVLRCVAYWLLPILCLYLVCGWNMNSLGPFQVFLANVLRLEQRWNMFAPYPIRDDGWYIIPGRMANGKDVELWSNEGVPWASAEERASWTEEAITTGDGVMERDVYQLSRKKPEVPSAVYSNARWRKFMENLRQEEYEGLRLYFGKYICRKWNWGLRNGGAVTQLETFQIVYMKEETPPPGNKSEVVPVQIWSHDCGPKKVSSEHWSALPDKLKEAAAKLGYGETSWDDKEKRMPIYAKSLDELSAEEIAAALELRLTSNFRQDKRHERRRSLL